MPSLPLGPVQGDLIFIKPGSKIGAAVTGVAPRLFVLLGGRHVGADRVYVDRLPLALFQKKSGRQDGPGCAAARVDKRARAERQPGRFASPFAPTGT